MADTLIAIDGNYLTGEISWKIIAKAKSKSFAKAVFVLVCVLVRAENWSIRNEEQGERSIVFKLSW